MVLAQDSSSLESEIGQPLEDRYWQSGEELGAIQTSHSGQTFSQESRSHSVERSEQEQRSELHDASHASYLLSPFTSTLLPRYSEAPSKCALGRRLSFTRNITPENSRRQSQDDARAHILSFNQQEASAFVTGSDDTGTDLAYAQVVSSRRQSIASNIHGSCNTSQQTKQPVLESSKTSWIRKLSDINLELHQHMLSIPPIGARQSAWTSNDPNSIQHKKELAVDRTFKLANKYTEILNEIVSRFKSCQAYTRPTTDSLALDQPSQLLVLCSYLCLVELFDKALQHIKTWTEVRLKMGLSASDHFPIHLPGLAIGSFKLPTSSSIQPLILTCTIEATIRHMHSLVGDMMTPSNTESWKERNPTSATAEKDTSARGELSSVAKVTLQAIRAKEDSTTELIQQTWKLALRCDVP